MAWTAAGTWGAAACANTLNQVRALLDHASPVLRTRLTAPLVAHQIMEVRNDSLMKRTHRRPLPSGAMSRRHAIAFALCAGVSGVGILYTQVRSSPLPRSASSWTDGPAFVAQANPTTAALGAANIALYAAVYTPLKQISVVNTWVGALVGAIPPLMGCVVDEAALPA